MNRKLSCTTLALYGTHALYIVDKCTQKRFKELRLLYAGI